MTQVIKASKIVSNADGTTTSTSFGGLQAPSMDELNSLQNQLTDAQNKLIIAKNALASIQADRHNCKRTIGWNNSCLDTNTANANQQQSVIDNLTATIDDLSKNKIPSAQARYNQLNSTYQASLAAQASTNPDIIKAATDLQTQLSSASNKKIWIIGIAAGVVLISIGILLYLAHKQGKLKLGGSK